MGCKKFFTDGHEKSELCSKLQEVPDVLAWELETASDFSPGVVENLEAIIRQIFSPIHVDDDGKITPAGLNEAISHGLSTNRLKYISELDVVSKGIDKQNFDNQNSNRTPKNFIGVTDFEASMVREITDHNGSKGLAIFDTASKDNISHSDLFCFLPQKSWRSIRSKLLTIANTNFRLVYMISSKKNLEK